VSGLSWVLRFVMVAPASENVRSEEVLVAGIAKTDLAHALSRGHTLDFCCQNSSTLSDISELAR